MTNTLTQPIFETATRTITPLISDSQPHSVSGPVPAAQNDNNLQVSENVLVRRRRRVRSRMAH